MIRLRDSLTLSLTKLRTRKVRLIVTVIVSGLLFCGLAAVSIVVRGAFGSIDAFNNEGFGKRYIVQGMPQQDYTIFQSPKVIDRAIAIQKDLVARKKAAAKTLGLDYDPSVERSPVQEYDGPGGKQRNLDFSNPIAQQALDEVVPANTISADDLNKIAQPYQGVSSYKSTTYSGGIDGSALQVLKLGKEAYGDANQRQAGIPSGTDSFTAIWSLMSGDLMKPFLLKDATLADKGDGTIPIIVPVSAAEQLLGLKSLPASATSTQKLDRMKKLRTDATKLTFQVCYRNSTSVGLVNSAVSTAQEIELNKNKKDYKKPDLIYGLPTQPCGPVPITRDVRDADTKALAAKQEKFDVMFGKQPSQQQSLSFRVVGMSPDFSNGQAFSVSQVISSLVTSSLGTGWFTPQEYQAKVPLLTTLFKQTGVGYSQPPLYFEEFPTADDARQFIEKQNCQPDFGGITEVKVGVSSDSGFNPFAECTKNGKLFNLSPYGSNSLALESARKGFNKFFSIATLVAAIIAAIIMMGTVGRMIADSRRETAVFRAIGAKKLDIAQVYVLYTLLLALLICIFSLSIGMIAAAIANHILSPDATVQALVAYNAQDLSRKFVLFYFYPMDILRLVGLVITASIISSFLPLIRNLRRNPIRDMRDDT